MEHWHPSKVTAVIGLVTLLASVLGSALVSGSIYGTLNHAVAMCVERLDRHVVQIKDNERRHDLMEARMLKSEGRTEDIWELLKEMRTRQMDNLRISSDNNKMLRNGH